MGSWAQVRGGSGIGLRAARDLARQLQEAGVRLDAVFINAGMAKFAAVADVDEAVADAREDAAKPSPGRR